MFDKIQNPKTGRWVKTNSALGKKILNQYKQQLGGNRWEDVAREAGIEIPDYEPAQPGDYQLLKLAIASQSSNKVRRVLQEGINPNQLDEFTRDAALATAIKMLRPKFTEREGFLFNHAGVPPAVPAPHPDPQITVGIVQALIDYGGDVNLPNDAGETPMHLAAHHCMFEIYHEVENAGGQDWEAPFILAVKKIYVFTDLIRLLKNLGANLNIVDIHGRKPIDTYIARRQIAQNQVELDLNEIPNHNVEINELDDINLHEEIMDLLTPNAAP